MNGVGRGAGGVLCLFGGGTFFNEGVFFSVSDECALMLIQV